MGILYKAITLLAAIIVLILGGARIAEVIRYRLLSGPYVYESHPTGILDEQPVGVPVVGPGNLRLWTPAYAETVMDLSGANNGVIIPVFYERSAGNAALQLGQRGKRAIKFLGNCDTSPIVNIIYNEIKTDVVKTVFNERVYLPSVGIVPYDTSDQVVSLVVRQDSNNDGWLSCEDWAELEFYSPQTEEVFRPEFRFDARSTSFRLSEDFQIYAALDVPGDEGLIAIKIYEIDARNKSVREIIVPDLNAAAVKAFTRVDDE